jgi:hypothetical protein
MVFFQKQPELGLGLRLAGGNATGIFIASVQQLYRGGGNRTKAPQTKASLTKSPPIMK